MDSETKFCTSCGQKILKKAVMCPHCGATVANLNGYYAGKNKVIAAVFAFTLGALGIHWFYLGKKMYGAIMLMAGLISLILGAPLYVIGYEDAKYSEEAALQALAGMGIIFITVLIACIQGVRILTLSDEKFNALYLNSDKDDDI